MNVLSTRMTHLFDLDKENNHESKIVVFIKILPVMDCVCLRGKGIIFSVSIPGDDFINLA